MKRFERLFGYVVLPLLVASVAPFAEAGTGIGGVFNLGTVNKVNARTLLTGATSSGMLRIRNSRRIAGATALGLSVPAGHAPLTVNSDTKVANLNADRLDGRDSTSFTRGNNASIYGLAVAVPGGTTFMPSPPVAPGLANVGLTCGGPNGSETITTDLASGNMNVASSGVTQGVLTAVISSGHTFEVPTNAKDITTETVQAFVNGSQRISTITVTVIGRSVDCHFQVQAITSDGNG